MSKQKTFKMTEDEYRQKENDYIGLCLDCSSERWETEGDAENYPCEDCEGNNVQGILNLLAAGRIEII